MVRGVGVNSFFFTRRPTDLSDANNCETPIDFQIVTQRRWNEIYTLLQPMVKRGRFDSDFNSVYYTVKYEKS